MYTLPVLLIFRNIRENSLELLSLCSCEGKNEMESRAIRTKKKEEEGRKRKEISMQEMEIMAKGKVANMRVIRL